MTSKLIIWVFLVLFLAGCSHEKENEEYAPLYSLKPPFHQTVYLFGVHPLHNPKRLFEVYQPMVEYINKRLVGGELRLEASRNYDSFEKKLFAEQFQFALPNPYQTVKAAEHGYTIFGKMGDDKNFKGIILVRKDSQIKKVTDLKGKTVSYPAPTALAATMMPQRFLHDSRIDVRHDITNIYVGSQESSIMSVSGKSAAGATWPPPWKAFIKARPEIAKEVKIQWETATLPSNGLVVHHYVPEHIAQQVADIITQMHTNPEGKAILDAMELSRYDRANYQTYEPVRAFLRNFEKDIRPIGG